MKSTEFETMQDGQVNTISAIDMLADLKTKINLGIFGRTGSGKSSLLWNFMFEALKDDNAVFVLMDLKSGEELSPFAVLPQTQRFTDNVHEVLPILEEVNRIRERRSIRKREDGLTTQDFSRLYVIIDEYPSIVHMRNKKTSNAIIDALIDLFNKGRSVNIMPVITAQESTKECLSNIKSSITSCVALNCSRQDCKNILGHPGAEMLKPGQCLYQPERENETSEKYCVDVPYINQATRDALLREYKAKAEALEAEPEDDEAEEEVPFCPFEDMEELQDEPEQCVMAEDTMPTTLPPEDGKRMDAVTNSELSIVLERLERLEKKQEQALQERQVDQTTDILQAILEEMRKQRIQHEEDSARMTAIESEMAALRDEQNRKCHRQGKAMLSRFWYFMQSKVLPLILVVVMKLIPVALCVVAVAVFVTHPAVAVLCAIGLFLIVQLAKLVTDYRTWGWKY